MREQLTEMDDGIERSSPGDLEILIRDQLTLEGLHIHARQEAILVTIDKIELCLIKHLARAEARKAWVAPFGILIALVTTLLSAEFKKDFFFPAQVWHAVFVIGAGIVLVWLIAALTRFRRSLSVDDLIREIAGQRTEETKGKSDE